MRLNQQKTRRPARGNPETNQSHRQANLGNLLMMRDRGPANPKLVSRELRPSWPGLVGNVS